MENFAGVGGSKQKPRNVLSAIESSANGSKFFVMCMDWIDSMTTDGDGERREKGLKYNNTNFPEFSTNIESKESKENRIEESTNFFLTTCHHHLIFLHPLPQYHDQETTNRHSIMVEDACD